MFDRVLITGGAGFAGSSLAIGFRKRWPDCRVTAFDNLRRRGSELILPRLSEHGVEFVHGDVRSAADVAALPAPGLIVECSAEPSAQYGYGGSPEYLVRTNLEGCFHCLELARRAGSRFLFVSTSRVYPYAALNALRFEEDETRYRLRDGQEPAGASEQGIAENFTLAGPRSLYGMTKLAGELMVEEYGDAYGLPWIIDRCGLLAGPWQMGKTDQGVVAHWLAAHYFRRPLAYIGFGGSGKQVRDVLHIDDFVDLILLQAASFDGFSGRIWNAGGGLENSVSLLELTRLCEEATSNRLPISSQADNRPADVRIYISDCRSLRAACRWKAARDARKTVGDVLLWLREHESLLSSVLDPNVLKTQ